MRTIALVAADLLREAASRKWVLAIGIGVTLLLAALALGLNFEVVDGALSATRLFGKVFDREIKSADVALRPVFQAAAYLVFYVGTAFGILACADFGPSLLSPGRIEHKLSLPVRRWELFVGTFVGVAVLASLGALYGTGGLVVMLGWKTGVWTARPLAAALLISVAFAALYAAMLTSAVFVRSAAFSGAVGFILFVAGCIASFRADILPLFEEGLGRTLFDVLTLPLPRIATLGDAAAHYAAAKPVELAHLGRTLGGIGVFTLALLALGIWRFEDKDF